MNQRFPSRPFFSRAARRTGTAAGRRPGSPRRRGFTLVEVVLAVGVLSLSVVALLGLFGPTMGSVKNVVDRSGALAVADQLNAELMSNQIYRSIGTAENPETFTDFADKLKAAGAADTLFLYAWREYASAPSDTAPQNLNELKVKISSVKPTAADLPRIDGTVYLLMLNRGLSGEYNFNDVATSAYFPIAVSIFELSGDKLTSDTLSGTVLTAYATGDNGKPIFQYTTAKLR